MKDALEEIAAELERATARGPRNDDAPDDGQAWAVLEKILLDGTPEIDERRLLQSLRARVRRRRFAASGLSLAAACLTAMALGIASFFPPADTDPTPPMAAAPTGAALAQGAIGRSSDHEIEWDDGFDIELARLREDSSEFEFALRGSWNPFDAAEQEIDQIEAEMGRDSL